MFYRFIAALLLALLAVAPHVESRIYVASDGMYCARLVDGMVCTADLHTIESYLADMGE